MRYKKWLEYFTANRNHFDHLDWSDEIRVSFQERELISRSIKQFQRGEHSEGKHFLSYARSLHDLQYLETVRLFIKEEQDHAAVLGRFMDKQGIDKIKSDWLDNTFRWLRKLSGLEVTVTVLITAEILAFPFYKALASCTRSKVLREICEQILIDEEMHIRFQSYTLKSFHKERRPIIRIITRWMHKLLMTGTILMVWLWHHRVLKAGGYNFVTHFQYAWSHFHRCEEMIRGKLGIQIMEPTSEIKTVQLVHETYNL